MVSWSTLRPLLTGITSKSFQNAVVKRSMSGDHGHRTFPYQPSRWQWNKFKDFANFYILLGVIPLTAIVTYCNVFIGPATLSEIPEGYEPKYWEYYRHPITRFIARYILNDPQQDYEKYLHYLYEEEEKRRIRKVEDIVKTKMSERQDYQAYYYRPVTAKYHRQARETADNLDMYRGD